MNVLTYGETPRREVNPLTKGTNEDLRGEDNAMSALTNIPTYG